MKEREERISRLAGLEGSREDEIKRATSETRSEVKKKGELKSSRRGTGTASTQTEWKDGTPDCGRLLFTLRTHA